MEFQLIFHWKEDYLMSSSQWITIEMKLVKFSNVSRKGFPHGYKFNWIAFRQDNPEEKVLFDNHHGKDPHFHVNGREEFFVWISPNQAQALFFQKVRSKFGDFSS